MKKAFSKSLSWLLSVALMFSVFVFTDTIHLRANAANTADDLVAVAEGELGSTNYSKYYGGHQGAWCADFVSWCAQQAGVDSIALSSSSTAMYEGMTQRNGCQETNDPQKGDIVFFYCDSCGEFCHVGIMVNSTTSIDGNYSNKVSYDNSYSHYGKLGYKHSAGIRKIYVRPLYNGSSSFSGDVDYSYAVPVSLIADHQCDTYNSAGNKESGHYISPGDNCYIETVYTNGFCHVKYDLDGGGTRWAYAWAGDFPIPKIDPPKNVWLGKNQNWYDINDTIYLAPHADGADYYWFSVYKGEQHIIDQAIYSEYSFPANQWGYGDYSAYITAANSAGGTDSERIYFSVVGSPTYSNIRTAKETYEINDTVEISVDTVCAKGQVIGIDKDGVGRVVTEECGSTFSISASQLGAGSYSAYFTVYNGSGGTDTTRIQFKINGYWPSKTTLGAYVGTNFAPTTFGWNATENTTHYALKIWKGTCWDGPSYKEFLVYDTSYVVDLPAGYYEAYVDSLNEYGWTCSDVIKFTVEYDNPYDSGDDFYANIIRNDDWGHLADVDGNVIINNNGSKLWHFTKTSDGGYFIQNVVTGKYLDVSNASDENGCNVQTCNYNGSAAQIWYRYGRWGEYLKPKCTANRIMDIDRASGNAQIWDLEYNDNQKLAIWIYDKFNISYDMNGGVGNISNQVKVDCYDTTISSIIPTRTGYNFVGWSKNKNAITAEYPSGATFKENENTTLYAIWKPDYNLQPTSKDEFNGHTYEYYNQAFTWDEAYKFCEKKGGHLVTINSQEENDFLVELTKKRSANLWAGGKTTDNEKWFWITGEPFDYQNWNVGEPNNLENIQDTLQIYTSGKWDDVSTGAYTCQFVCEYDDKIDASKYTPVYKENYNGHEYWFFENDVDWQTAKKICEAKGGYLVVIDNAEENQKVMSGIQKTSKKEAWIGITDIKDNVWKDVKGNNLTYTNWASGEPNNNSDIEDYGNLFEDGTWNDLMGYGYIYRSIGFVCEFDDLCTGSGHKYVEKIVAPTSTAKGYTLHTCSVCKHSYKDNYTNVLLSNNSILSAETIKLGETITATAKATGGTGEYLYQVVYKQTTQSKWTTAQSYKANATVTFKPASATTYDVCVKVKDSNNTEVKKFFTVKVTSDELKNVSTISAQTINLGSTVTVNAKATGSTGFYTYAVYYKQKTQTKWTTKQDFKANNTIAVKPAKATTYDICVKVKDDKGTIVKKYFTVNVTDFTNTSTLSATEIKLGNTVKVSCSATGSTGYYQYAVYYKKTSDTKWTTKQSYSSNNTVTIKPAKATTYDVCVKVKDNQNNEVKKYFTVTVK